MLRTKLFKAFVALVLLFGVLSAVVGVRTIRGHVVAEAQNRVRLDLSAAWSVYNSRMHEIEIILRLVAAKELVVGSCSGRDWQSGQLQERLERIRVGFELDFLDVITPEGRVAVRATPPHAIGDLLVSDAAIASALKGQTKSCMTLLAQAQLENEADGLAEQAFLELEDTPRARRTDRHVESRGMAMVGAVPVMNGLQVVGAVYGGLLVNRNHDLIDRIHNVVYKSEVYKGVPLGTATIFLHDSRVTTTVRQANGNRAIGTRVSKEVADRVLDNGQAWIGDAFVVRDWYLTAYEPIRDGWDDIIGMLYVGILKKPFQDYGRNIAMRYVLLSLFVLCVALVLAFIIAGRLAKPIQRLVAAAEGLGHGAHPPPVSGDDACKEVEMLINAFNEMADSLADREEKLKALNRSYMETLGFVSHELKSPVASIMNYAYLLHQQMLGPLTEKQQKAVRSIDSGSKRLVEMVRHYLNLSRIENGELAPVRMRVSVVKDVLDPLLEAAAGDAEQAGMRIENRVAEDVELNADLNMVREVFENLLGNALKYGRQGGIVRIGYEPAPAGFAKFDIWNEGEGIPAEGIENLFRKFARLEGTKATAKQRGTGLGLFITKHIVEAHGGEVGVRSQVGAWAEFSVTLPLYQEGPMES